MTDKILFVDDEENILAAFQRQLRNYFPIETAINGQQGLDTLTRRGPFAVIVADMRMPEMDGVQFLAKVKELDPNSIRIMLTGNADQETAIQAINDGHIFRFLTKPCPTETLVRSLKAGITQYHLVKAEKELLEKTLVGSIKMLIEILSVVNPAAFGRSTRVRRVVVHIVEELELEDAWQYELAAALSQIGWIIFPPDLLNKIIAQMPLTESESQLYMKHPLVGRKILEQIPRLERIAQMIEGQLHSSGELIIYMLEGEEEIIKLGSQLLKLAIDYDQRLMKGMTHKATLSVLRQKKGDYTSKLLDALTGYLSVSPESVGYTDLSINELNVGMVFAEDVRDRHGELIVSKGQELTYPLLTYLFSLAARKNFLKDTYKVITNDSWDTSKNTSMV